MSIDKTTLVGAAMIAAILLTNSASDATSLLGRRHYAPSGETNQTASTVDFRLQPGYQEDLLNLALVMWHEARGEGEHGMEAIGHVILNRVQTGIWGDNINQVLRAPGQFAAFRGRMPRNVEQIRTNYKAGKPIPKQFEESLRIAERLLNGHILGQRQDTVKAATYFHHRRESPNWTKRMRFVMVKGEHKFWKQTTVVASR